MVLFKADRRDRLGQSKRAQFEVAAVGTIFQFFIPCFVFFEFLLLSFPFCPFFFFCDIVFHISAESLIRLASTHSLADSAVVARAN